MPPPQLPKMPDSLKSLKKILEVARLHDERDIVVAYWCRLEAIQQGLQMSTKSMEETQFFMKLMQWLEQTKKENSDNEAITNDIVAQAHLENQALKLFLYADENDRAGNFNKNVIHAFYTSSVLYQLMKTFGPLSEEAQRNMKYANWKAVYIQKCLKNGETPIPGPVDKDEENQDPNTENNEEEEIEVEENEEGENLNTDNNNENNEEDDEKANPSEETKDENISEDNEETEKLTVDAEEENNEEENTSKDTELEFPSVPSVGTKKDTKESDSDIPIPVTPNQYNPAPTPTNGSSSCSFDKDILTVKTEGGVELKAEQIVRAQKLIKWAGSALNYDDITTTISNLRRALNLLTTGKEDV